MLRFALRRLVLTLPTILAAATLVFILVHLVPGDPIDVMLGETAQPADREALRHTLGLDRPLARQYATFLHGLATGDLGRSLVQGAPVATLLTSRLPATVELTVAALAIAILLAMPLGLAAAARPGTGSTAARSSSRCSGSRCRAGSADVDHSLRDRPPRSRSPAGAREHSSCCRRSLGFGKRDPHSDDARRPPRLSRRGLRPHGARQGRRSGASSPAALERWRRSCHSRSVRALLAGAVIPMIFAWPASDAS
jgi:hypothetical protein